MVEEEQDFKIGDEVVIRNVTNYHTDYNKIPENLIIHGIATLHYQDPKAKIVDKFNQFFIVNFINSLDKEMQLGYLAEDLLLIKRENVLSNLEIW